MNAFSGCIVVLLCLGVVQSLYVSPSDDQPLILTPYIKTGDIELARNLSRVEPFDDFNDTASYSGFITVNSSYQSNIFFWFFLSKNDSAEDPVILFFNGGPGVSSLFGLFGEIGPFSVRPDLNLSEREHNWVNLYNVIFVDLPVGAGFSFTKDIRGYATEDHGYALQAHEFLQQFFAMFPELAMNDLYLSGESYSGKAAVTIASHIHKTDLNSTLKGLILISSFIDPLVISNSLGHHLYHVGLINEKQQLVFQRENSRVIEFLERNQSMEALDVLLKLILNYAPNDPTTFFNFTGYIDYSDLSVDQIPVVFNDYARFIQQPNMQQKIHTGNVTFKYGFEVIKALERNILQSGKGDLEYLLDNDYKVLFMNGNMDLLMNPVAQRELLYSLNWTGAAEYREAERIIWNVSEEVAGYVTIAHNLVEVMVRNAGHMIPHNRPQQALDAVTKFVYELPFD